VIHVECSTLALKVMNTTAHPDLRHEHLGNEFVQLPTKDGHLVCTNVTLLCASGNDPSSRRRRLQEERVLGIFLGSPKEEPYHQFLTVIENLDDHWGRIGHLYEHQFEKHEGDLGYTYIKGEELDVQIRTIRLG
jgi:hypothetical protein